MSAPPADSLLAGLQQTFSLPLRIALMERPVEYGNVSWCVFHDDRPFAMTQMAAHPETNGAALAESRARLDRLLRGAGGAELAPFVPQACGDLQVGPCLFHLWRWSEGRRFRLRDPDDLPALLAAAGTLLQALQRARRAHGARPLTASDLIVSTAPPELQSEWIELLMPHAANSSCGLIHGDFWWGNLLMGGESPVLLDWEEIDFDQPAWFDPLLFALTLVLDLEARGERFKLGAAELLRWCAAETMLPAPALRAGLRWAAWRKVERERLKYRQFDTPVQRWLAEPHE